MQSAEDRITAAVLERLGATPDPRLRKMMLSLIGHLHAFVRDVEPTEQEWFTAIQFLTETGQKCDGKVRQEFILLSDTLGVSMLVDAINHRKSVGATESTVFGPFYIAGMPERAAGENMAKTPGEPALIHGRVTTVDGRPLAGAVLDVWQTATNGMYSGRTPHNRKATCAANIAPMRKARTRFLSRPTTWWHPAHWDGRSHCWSGTPRRRLPMAVKSRSRARRRCFP